MHNGEHPPLSRRRAHASQPGRHRQPGDHPVAYRDVFAVSEFRALWSAQALSLAGRPVRPGSHRLHGLRPDRLGTPRYEPHHENPGGTAALGTG